MGSTDGIVYGIPDLRIKPRYIRAALELLIDGANRLRAKKLIKADMDEDPITNYLSYEMKDAQRAGKSDIIFWDIRVDTQSDLTRPTTHW